MLCYFVDYVGLDIAGGLVQKRDRMRRGVGSRFRRVARGQSPRGPITQPPSALWTNLSDLAICSPDVCEIDSAEVFRDLQRGIV